jgi:hypothetical protein
MKEFVLLHYGFVPPTQEIMDAWSNWFASIGDRLVKNVGPFVAGREITHTGTKKLSLDTEAITGFTIIRADSIDDAERVAKGCPFITGIRVYEAKSM